MGGVMGRLTNGHGTNRSKGSSSHGSYGTNCMIENKSAFSQG
jgi:hypothetical protein